MAHPHREPEIGVILTSDYHGGGDKSWADLRHTLAALACQDFDGAAEFLLVESAEYADRIPEDLEEILPTLCVVLSDAGSSYGLKNAGVEAAHAELVAILDADCAPKRDWLRRLVEALTSNPWAAVVSGRTQYEGTTRLERLLALHTRSYLDPGKAGPSRFISNNNAGWRRAAYLEHPMPTDSGAFANRMQSEAMLRAGFQFYFDPSVRVIHDFEGWPMESDIRRNIGFGTIITRMRDSRVPYAWLTRFGRLSIPAVVAGKMLNGFGDCLRCWRHYGVRWYELPLALALTPVLHLMEVRGMWEAFGGRKLAGTAYR